MPPFLPDLHTCHGHIPLPWQKRYAHASAWVLPGRYFAVHFYEDLGKFLVCVVQKLARARAGAASSKRWRRLTEGISEAIQGVGQGEYLAGQVGFFDRHQ